MALAFQVLHYFTQPFVICFPPCDLRFDL